MTIQNRPPQGQRLAVLTTVCGLHCLALLLVFVSKSDVVPPPMKLGALSVVSLNAESPSQTPPPPPALPSKLAEQRRPPTEISFSNQPDSTAVAAPLGGCATLEVVTNALMADGAAIDAIHNAPRETRSIADAVMMWNAGWSEAAQTIDAPLGQVRAIAEQSLHSVDEGCLEEVIAGPRLVPIPAGEGTMFIVFGSGNWRWRELMFGPDAAQHAAFYNAPPPATLWPF